MPVPVGAIEAAASLAAGRPDWHAHGACRGLDPELFFPERGENVASAKAICAECPVQTECLDFAVDNAVMHGIWGGKSERERRRLRVERKRARTAATTYCPVCDADLHANHSCNPSPDAERRRRYPRNRTA